MESKDLIQKLLVGILYNLIGSLICFIAWNSWAWEFNLPTFSYWHWVITFIAIRNIFGQIKQGE